MIKTDFGYEVSLKIFHPPIDPQEISRALSIAPTHACKAGSGRATPKSHPLPGDNRETFWLYHFGSIRGF